MKHNNFWKLCINNKTEKILVGNEKENPNGSIYRSQILVVVVGLLGFLRMRKQHTVLFHQVCKMEKSLLLQRSLLFHGCVHIDQSFWFEVLELDVMNIMKSCSASLVITAIGMLAPTVMSDGESALGEPGVHQRREVGTCWVAVAVPRLLICFLLSLPALLF